MRLVFPVLLTLMPLAATAQERVVALGGSVTEIVYALGEEGRLVGRDTTSTFPPQAQALPDLGYMRALSAEGVLSVNPDLILAEEGAGPPAALDLLKQGGIPFVIVPDARNADDVAQRIEVVGKALGVGDKAVVLAEKVRTDIAAVTANLPDEPRRVLFLLSVTGGKLMAGGTGTAADAIIRLAGGINVADGFSGYKTLTDEALGASAPDVILLMDRGASDPKAETAAALERLRGLPALAATPAVRDGKVVSMDGLYLLGFGPRTAAAASDLSRMLTQ